MSEAQIKKLWVASPGQSGGGWQEIVSVAFSKQQTVPPSQSVGLVQGGGFIWIISQASAT